MSAVPPEPEALRVGLRQAVGERPEEAHELVAAALAAYLGGSCWEAVGSEVDLLARVLEAARYEAYLWVMGDRRWTQLTDTLEGRLRRRRQHPAGRTRAATGRVR